MSFSIVLYLGGAAIFEYSADPFTWGVAVFFSLAPDIDLPTSRISRPLFFVSAPLEKYFSHRTIPIP